MGTQEFINTFYFDNLTVVWEGFKQMESITYKGCFSFVERMIYFDTN